MNHNITDKPYYGSGQLTREQFLFQFPTEKSVKRVVNGCLRRLRCMGDDSLIKTIAHSSMLTKRRYTILPIR